jgi:hypothetical protein
MEKEKKELAWDWQLMTQIGMSGAKNQNELMRTRIFDADDTCMRGRVKVESKKLLFVQTTK